MPTFNYTVDGEPQATTKHEMTPREIMTSTKPKAIDPANHYLVEMVGDHQESYEGKPDAVIHIHQHQEFISVFTGETVVS